MQPSRNRKTSRNLYRNPMPEVHSETRKMGAKLYVPLRKIVQKERPSRLDCTYAFRDPLFTPLQIVAFRSQVIGIFPVTFAEVKRWVGKNGVNDRIPDVRKDSHAVTGKKCSESRDIGCRELDARFKVRVQIKDPRVQFQGRLSRQ